MCAARAWMRPHLMAVPLLVLSRSKGTCSGSRPCFTSRHHHRERESCEVLRSAGYRLTWAMVTPSAANHMGSSTGAPLDDWALAIEGA